MRTKACVKTAQGSKIEGRCGIRGRGAPRYPRWDELEMTEEHKEGLWDGSVLGVERVGHGCGEVGRPRTCSPIPTYIIKGLPGLLCGTWTCGGILVQGRVMAAWTMAMPVRMEMR